MHSSPHPIHQSIQSNTLTSNSNNSFLHNHTTARILRSTKHHYRQHESRLFMSFSHSPDLLRSLSPHAFPIILTWLADADHLSRIQIQFNSKSNDIQSNQRLQLGTAAMATKYPAPTRLFSCTPWRKTDTRGLSPDPHDRQAYPFWPMITAVFVVGLSSFSSSPWVYIFLSVSFPIGICP